MTFRMLNRSAKHDFAYCPHISDLHINMPFLSSVKSKSKKVSKIIIYLQISLGIIKQDIKKFSVNALWRVLQDP